MLTSNKAGIRIHNYETNKILICHGLLSYSSPLCVTSLAVLTQPLISTITVFVEIVSSIKVSHGVSI
jgi:hypothetical protein